MGIGARLQQVLDSNKMNANELAAQLNVAPSTIYSIISRDNTKVDIELLFKICQIFGISAEEFYNAEQSKNSQIYLSEHERAIIIAYRSQPEMQTAVDKLLGVESSEAEAKKIG